MAQLGAIGSQTGFIDPENNAGNRVISMDDDANGGGIPFIEPTVIHGEPEGDPAPSNRKRRGRPTGSKNGTTTKRKETSQDLTAVIFSLHTMAAAFTKIPELELDEAESKKIGDAVSKVNELYGGIILSEKTQAWINLTFAVGAVYGPRAIAYKMRTANEAKKKPVTIDAQVIRETVYQ